MTLQEQINADLKAAMLNNDTATKDLLRVVIGELNRIDKVVPNDKVVATIKKMIENARVITVSRTSAEAIGTATKEIELLEKYLPKQLTEAELSAVIDNVVKTNSYTIKDMGKVMSFLKEQYGGRYDGKLASIITKEVLA